MRRFSSGAQRDTGNGKFEYYGFRHPLCEHSFASFMHEHRLMPDGTFRDSNNWWAGWDKDISLKSLARHFEDLTALRAGFCVYKSRVAGSEHTYILKKGERPGADWRMVTEEETCNAIRFNADAYKLQLLK